jgi:predicted permease
MLSPATKRLVVPVLLGVVSLALFLRGSGYYLGSGPHDGEDLPSFVIFLAGSAALLAAVLSWGSARRRWRKLWLIGICLSGVLLLITLAWWVLNVRLERWAS